MVVRVCEVATDQKVGDSSPSERTPECALIKGVDPVAAWASGPMTLAATRGGLVQHVLSNSFGFGGTNACLVLSRFG